MHVKIEETGPTTGTCQVERAGPDGVIQRHSCLWNDDGHVWDTRGDLHLLKAVLTAWDGEMEFDISDDELARRSGGWWSPEP